MSLDTIKIGKLDVSRMIIGGNPFSGFSHQNPDRDRAMLDYYTVARIKETLHQAEQLGINTCLGRADRHMARTMREYWNEGGTIRWVAQTASELISLARSIDEAIKGGAHAICIHGGKMDNLLAQQQLDQVAPAIEMIHKAGLPAGIAGHVPQVHEWAEANVDADFYLCSYYNPTSRAANAEHKAGMQERFDDEDRERMVKTIARLSKPAIHYKVLAAGRKTPQEAFAFVAQHLRPQDAVCVGFFTQDNPNMIAEDLALLQESLRQDK